MDDFFTLGPVPSDEPCAQVGEEDYRTRAVPECRRYIDLLRKTFGEEPEGTRLAVKWFAHDFGDYCEVVCYFDPEIPDSVAYAQRCESDAPTTWEG
jgi:hypothetical protein